MTKMSKKTHKKLLDLARKHNLTTPDIARLALVEVETVKSWRKTPGVSSHRTVPPGSMELLELKLGEKKLELHK